MNKEEILDKLRKCSLDLDECIIIGGASLVVQGLLDETTDIDLACSKNYYDSINWDYDTSIESGDVVKMNDCFSISSTFFDKNKVSSIPTFSILICI